MISFKFVQPPIPRKMNKLILSLCFLAGFLPAIAQKQYFIYLQSENNQPFHVTMGEKSFTSTASGYLILSKIPDTTIQVKIWFTYDRSPQQTYSIHVKRRDHGYLIRNFAEKGWGLFDLQDLSVTMSTAAIRPSSSGKASVMNTSAFAGLLAKASDDPSLMEAVVRTAPEPVIVQVKKEEPVKKTEEPKAGTDVAKTNTEKKEEPDKQKPVVDDKSVETAVVKKEEPLKKTEEPKKTETEIAKNNSTVKEAEVTQKQQADNKPVETTIEKKEPPETKKIVDPTAVPIGSGPVVVNKDDKKERQKNEDAEKKKETASIKDPLSEKENTSNTGAVTANTDQAKTVTEEKKVETEAAKSSRPESITEKVKTEEKKKEEPYKKSVVTKNSEQSTAQGYGVVYVDANTDGTKDTVSIVIPENKPAVAIKEVPKEEKKFLEISSEKKAEDSLKTAAAVMNVCNYTANNNDFFKLRKDMAAAEGNDEMLTLARKYFKMKCYTVSQVKSLGSLFLEDEGRYQFYDAVYRHTTDPVNFASLETELKDPYYVNRFKAMLRN